MKLEKALKGKPIYTACCVCKKVQYENQIIDVKKLNELVGENTYFLSHTFLSKKCLDVYMPEFKNKESYKKLDDYC